MALARSGSNAALSAQFRQHFLPTSTQAQLDASCEAWDAYIVEWRRSIAHELQTNEHGHLPRKQPALAAKLRASAFMGTACARRWLLNYVWPCTSQRTSQRPALERLVSQSVTVSLHTLAREAQSLFAWSPCTVLTRFERTVWPGVYVRRLLASAHTRSAPSTLNAVSGPRRCTTLLSVHSRRRIGQRDEARVSYDGQPFVSEVCRAVHLDEPRKPKAGRCWVPVTLLRAQKQDQAHVQACLLAVPRPSTPPPTLTAYLEQPKRNERRSPTPLDTSDDSDVQFIEARLREVIVLSDDSYST